MTDTILAISILCAAYSAYYAGMILERRRIRRTIEKPCRAVYAKTGHLESVTGWPMPKSWKTDCDLVVTDCPGGNFCYWCGQPREVIGGHTNG